jgi:hypothetical protein
MSVVVHPILGSFDPSQPGDRDAVITFAGHPVRFGLTIDTGAAPEDLKGLPQRPEDLVALDRAARAAILEDAQSDDEEASALPYLEHHQDLFGPEAASPEAKLSRLVLVNVALYPESEDGRVMLDYSIDPDATDYVLCVYFDPEGQPIGVNMES